MRSLALFVAREVPVITWEKNPRTGIERIDWCRFEVPVNQIKPVNKRVYQELVDAGKTYAVILGVHADMYGNISENALNTVSKFNPDLIFTCYPDEVRRLHPEFNVQLTGDSTLFETEEGSRVVRFTTNRL